MVLWLSMSMPLSLANQTGWNIRPTPTPDKFYRARLSCPAEIVKVINSVLVITVLGNGIKGKETITAEALLEVSSHMLPCMYLANAERQIHNQSGMQSVRWVQTRYNYTIRKQIISTHLQKASLGGESSIPPWWFISYSCNYLFERVQRMASHQMCIPRPDITITRFLEDRKKKQMELIISFKQLRSCTEGKWFTLNNFQVVSGSRDKNPAFEPEGKNLRSSPVDRRISLPKATQGGHD